MMLFITSDLSQLPVVSHDKPDTVVGMLGRKHVFTAYLETLRALKAQA
jgi:CIC family chloride channel protein